MKGAHLEEWERKEEKRKRRRNGEERMKERCKEDMEVGWEL